MTQDYGFTTEETTEEALLGGHPAIAMPITLLSSGSERTCAKGLVLGVVTASGKYSEYDDGNDDGTEDAAVILAEEVTVPASGDENAIAYVHGEFIKTGLNWDSAVDATAKTAAYAALYAAGIFCK